MRSVAVFALAVLLAAPANGQRIIHGAVEAVEDGRTLVIGGARIRLWGIRTPATSQVCTGADGRAYHCGRLAMLMLDALTQDRAVACTVVTGDSETLEARCRTHSDLASILVLTGQAFDVPDESGGHYQAEQLNAIVRKAGVWANPAPWMFPEGKGEP